MPETARLRILLVEDEPALLLLMQRYLSRLGYDVEPCSTSEAAWEIFSAHADEYDLVLTDLTLPGMSGEEMVRKILETRPGIRVLLCSGYPFDPSVFAQFGSRIAFLQKPFMPDMLDRELRRLLDEPPKD